MKYRVSQLGGVAKRHNRGPSSRVGVHDRGGAVTAWCLPLLRQTCRSAQGHGQRANAPCQASMGEVEHTGFRAGGVPLPQAFGRLREEEEDGFCFASRHHQSRTPPTVPAPLPCSPQAPLGAEY